jgi:hypothetical protein
MSLTKSIGANPLFVNNSQNLRVLWLIIGEILVIPVQSGHDGRQVCCLSWVYLKFWETGATVGVGGYPQAPALSQKLGKHPFV